jgi:acetylornithine/succinyldiaminopimelate/putrescine aminotransferase
MPTKEKDKKYVGRDSEPIDLEIARSTGAFIFDSRGRKYIDFLMGWCVGNVGWGIKEIEKAVSNFKGPDYVAPGLLYKPWAELAGLLAKITPGKLVKSFRATGGTEAVEFALQAAMLYTKRNKFISVKGSYHGNSIAAFGAGSGGFDVLKDNFLKIPPPLDAEVGEEVERMISRKDIAGFIMEPIAMNLGVLAPEPEFMDIVSKACKKYGTLFIADEVATGFGRTGKMFACEHYDIEPDIMCLAKAISGGYGGIGTAIMTNEVAGCLEEGPGVWSTYGWHPRSVAAAIANISYLLKNKNEFLKNARTLSGYFRERLEKIKFEYKPEIRISGLAIAIEFVQEGYSEQIIKKAFTKGLLADAGRYAITMFPPLNLPQKIAEQGLDILEGCV